MKRYELWRTADGGQDSFFPTNNDSARNLLEPDARLIWTCEANSWNEAQQKRYDFMDWGTLSNYGRRVW